MMDIDKLNSRKSTLQEQLNVISIRYGELDAEKRDLQYRATVIVGRISELDALIEELARISSVGTEQAV